MLIYELNGPIRFNNSKDRDTLRQAWISWRSGINGDADILALTASRSTQAILKDEAASFEQHLERAIGRPTVALELLRQFCCCSRHQLSQDLVIIIEAADLMLPDAPVTQLNDNDRHRLSVCLDWFSDPGFSSAGDVVVLLADAASGIHQRIRAQAEVALVDVADPDEPSVNISFAINWTPKPGLMTGKIASKNKKKSRKTAPVFRCLPCGNSYVARPIISVCQPIMRLRSPYSNTSPPALVMMLSTSSALIISYRMSLAFMILKHFQPTHHPTL